MFSFKFTKSHHRTLELVDTRSSRKIRRGQTGNYLIKLGFPELISEVWKQYIATRRGARAKTNAPVYQNLMCHLLLQSR